MRSLLLTALSNALACTSLFASAHSMSPIFYGGAENALESITLSGVVLVPISVGSHQRQHFLITVDDEDYKKILVEAGNETSLEVPVKLFQPNHVELHRVCSIGLGEGFNTRICTRVKAYWLVDGQ